VIMILPAVAILNSFVTIPKVANFVVNGKRKNRENYKLFSKVSCLCKYVCCK